MQWLRLISFERNAAKELVLKDRSKKLSQTLKKSFYNSYIKKNDNVINSLTTFVVYYDIQLQYTKTSENEKQF